MGLAVQLRDYRELRSVPRGNVLVERWASISFCVSLCTERARVARQKVPSRSNLPIGFCNEIALEIKINNLPNIGASQLFLGCCQQGSDFNLCSGPHNLPPCFIILNMAKCRGCFNNWRAVHVVRFSVFQLHGRDIGVNEQKKARTHTSGVLCV
jgi:hypothetical protein